MEKVTGGGGLNGDGCARVGDVVGWRNDSQSQLFPEKQNLRQRRRCEARSNRKLYPPALAWASERTGHTNERILINGKLSNQETEKKRNGGRGGRDDEVEQVNGHHYKIDRCSEKETRKYLINGQGGGFRKTITYKNQYRDD
jgi:hypothetical protein